MATAAMKAKQEKWKVKKKKNNTQLIINKNERKLIAWNEAQAGEAKQITSRPLTLSDHLITASWLEPFGPAPETHLSLYFNFAHVNGRVDFSGASSG